MAPVHPHKTEPRQKVIANVFMRLQDCSQQHLEDGAGVGGDTGPQLGALLGHGAVDRGTLHLTLGVNDNTGVVWEREEREG